MQKCIKLCLGYNHDVYVLLQVICDMLFKYI